MDSPSNLTRHDREPPGAPLKAHKANLYSSPSKVTEHRLFLTAQIPGAPKADRIQSVKLSAQSPGLTLMATKHIASAFYPLWREYRQDDEDGAADHALSAAAKITPPALPVGPFRNAIVETLGCKTFTFDLDELWIDRNSNTNGLVTTLTVNVLEQKFIYRVDALGAGKDVSAENGHWEYQDIGKGGRARFWVEAEQIN